MSRRSWIGLSGFALLGCKERKSPASATSTPAPAAPLLKAGPFSVEVPDSWKDTAQIEKVAADPLYTPELWKHLKQAEADKDPAPPVHKPHFGNRPQHWAIRLPAALPNGQEPYGDPNDDPTAPQILIHKADEWAAIFSDGIDGLDRSPEVIRTMREEMNAAIRGDKVGPFPAEMDGALTFPCLKKRLDFNGGYGIRMLAQWTIEPQLMRKGELHYLFLGISDDNTCQILATFPISLPGLPDNDAEAEHLGRSVKRYEELAQNLDAYEKDATTWLEQHAAEITPGLDSLDEMLTSLVVRHWE